MNQSLLEKILAKGFPTQRDEQWKYTNLNAIAARAFKLSTPPASLRGALATKQSKQPLDCRATQEDAWLAMTPDGLSENYMIFVNGYNISSSFSDADKNKIKITPLEKPHHENLSGDIFEDLNQYFFQEGFSLVITQTLNHPLQILYFNAEESWVQPRHEIKIEKNTEAIIIESFQSNTSSIMNAVTKIEVDAFAKLTYIKIQQEHEKAFHIGRTDIILHEKASVKTFTFSNGSLLARSDINVKLAGEGAQSELYGLYAPHHRTHHDHHTHIEHAAKSTKSYELYHGVLRDQSRAVFNGKVLVQPHATHTEAEQANHNLLLSSEAEIDTKPELEIYCDDIKCTHGATIGQLDENAIFYLRTRGLDESSAKQLLVEAFSNKIFECISDENLRKSIKSTL